MAISMLSCGSFGEGLLAGMAGYGGTGFYGGGYSSSGYGGGNMNYLLDPAYAMAQVSNKQEQNYQEFSKYNKKADGSSYTRNEYNAMIAQAAYQSSSSSSSSSYSSSYSSSSSSSYSGSSSSSSSSRTCQKQSATDIAHCNGNRICSKCNGKKKYSDTSFGISHWVDPCVNCNGTGKCPGCGGTGKR